MKKFNLRYSNKGIASFIILILILANLFVFNARGIDFYNVNDGNFYERFVYDRLINSEVEDSLHNTGIFVRDKNFIRYFVKSEYISNYLITREFRENNPDAVVYKVNDEYLTFSSEEEFNERKNDEFGPKVTRITEKDLEEPVIENAYATNNSEYKKYKEKTMIENAKDTSYPYIVYNYNINGESKLEIFNNQNLTEQEASVIEIIKKIIGKVENPLQKGRNTKYISFEAVYQITPLVNKLPQAVENYNNLYRYGNNGLLVAFVVFIIFLIKASITDYKKTKDVGFYNWLKAIPIEIYAVILGLFVISCVGIAHLIVNSYFIETSELQIYLYILLSTLTLFIFITGAYYTVIFFKSLYYTGFRNFLFKNSIIIRIISYIYYSIKKILYKIYYFLIGKTLFNKILLLFLTFIIFMILIFVISIGRRFAIFAIFIFMISSYLILSKVIKDYSKIESSLNEIVKGNFNIKVNDEKTIFPQMSKNINRLGTSLQIALEKELKSERMKTELITNVSHDLKTPLTSIINYSDLATKEGISDVELKKYLRTINEKSLKLKNLIDNLFEMAKVTTNNIELNKMKIDLVQMMEQSIGEWVDELESKNIEIVMNTSKNSIICNLDGEQTYRIFDNIFSNLSKYTQENTRVYIDLIQDFTKTIITIKNISKYSLNISVEELKERFTRGDASRNTEGSGLGLAIATSLTELQGGKFNLEIDGDLFKVVIEFNN